MEEWIGGLWHKYITRKANPEFDDECVYFDQVSKSVAMVFRALGGDVVKRVEAATGREYLTRKSFLQKISGDNQLVSLAWQDEESLLLIGEALQSVGNRFAMYGFSSVKRSHIRFTMLKNFNENYNDQVRGRIQAITPGFYTRMGAEIRQATKVISEQKTTDKFLLILTDGKPNDIDHYEGRFGIEDTHQAINEAKRLAIKPFCISIDVDAQEYLPYLFGNDSFTQILRPAQLPLCLPQLNHQLTSQ